MTLNLNVIGMGYIGLPTAAVFAQAGLNVHGVDTDPDTVKAINLGKPHIFEPDLDALVARMVASGTLKASLKPTSADVYVIAVPTPIKKDKSPNLDFVYSATRAIAPFLAKENLIILESTSPVGATEKIAALLHQLRPDLNVPGHTDDKEDISIAYCPERVLPGRILHEVVHNDRVIGGLTGRCASRAARFYQIIVEGKCRTTSARTAEMSKLTENAFRDVNIAFANELSVICNHLDINVWDLIELANLHPRVNILNPGPGVGGHCIAVDPWFIVHSADKDAKLIKTAREVNLSKPDKIIKNIVDIAKASTKDTPNILCLGLAFKADVDDCRESPAIVIVKELSALKIGTVTVVDPLLNQLPNEIAGCDIKHASLEAGLSHADIVVLLTDHSVFKNIPAELLRDKDIIDTRGLWRHHHAS